jgi:hypothetical protein
VRIDTPALAGSVAADRGALAVTSQGHFEADQNRARIGNIN